MISAVDLFCGVGGLTHGLEQSGVKVVAGFDIDPICKYPFDANNNAVFINKDVAKLTGKEIQECWDGGSTTLLAGCAPCQPFSTYSRASRKAKGDFKWGLVRHFSRLVHESKPDLVTMENVAQITRHEVFDELLESLAEYNIWHSIVNCSDFGVPQTRKRLVLMASRSGQVELLLNNRRQKPTPTITTQCFGYGNGRFGHPEQDRAITLREAAMLQTFPRAYKFLRPNEKVVFQKMGRLIGNAVPVRLGKAIGNAFVKHQKLA